MAAGAGETAGANVMSALAAGGPGLDEGWTASAAVEAGSDVAG